MSTTPYTTRPIRRSRRSPDEIERLKLDLFEIVEAGAPMTVRQVFYQATTRGLIDKTENEYKNVVCRLLVQMRKDRDLPFGWIADGTRWMRKPKTFSSVERALGNIASTYRRSLWDNQDAYVEIWLEKEALAGVIYEVTHDYDVPLMVTRGYPSLTFLAEAAEEIDDHADKAVFVYYFGDLDPSGVDIARNVDESLNELAEAAWVNFERVAVTVEQVEQWDLPVRPTKRTDTRAKNWAGGSVEVDAIPPARLRAMVRECIEGHIDEDALEVVRIAEREEREGLRRLVNREVAR